MTEGLSDYGGGGRDVLWEEEIYGCGVIGLDLGNGVTRGLSLRLSAAGELCFRCGSGVCAYAGDYFSGTVDKAPGTGASENVLSLCQSMR